MLILGHRGRDGLGDEVVDPVEDGWNDRYNAGEGLYTGLRYRANVLGIHPAAPKREGIPVARESERRHARFVVDAIVP